MPPDQKGFWASFWGGAKEAGIIPEASADPSTPNAPPSASASDDAAAKAAAENAELRRQLAAAKAERVIADAEVFTKAQIGAGHALPVERAAILALYIRAAECDAALPRADGEPSTVALVEAVYATRPANQLSRELIKGAPAQTATVLPGSSSGGDPYADDVAETKTYGERMNGSRKS